MRVKILRIGVRELLTFFQMRGAEWPDRIYVHRIPNVPADASVIDVRRDDCGLWMEFTIQHDSFPEVQDNETVPIMNREEPELDRYEIAKLFNAPDPNEYNLVQTLGDENATLRGIFDDLRNDDVKVQAAFKLGVERALECVMTFLTRAGKAAFRPDRAMVIYPGQLVEALENLKADR